MITILELFSGVIVLELLTLMALFSPQIDPIFKALMASWFVAALSVAIPSIARYTVIIRRTK
jgi:hypothetical protein